MVCRAFPGRAHGSTGAAVQQGRAGLRRPAHGRYGSHPDGNDLPRLRKALRDFRAGRPIRQPVFDPATGEASAEILVPSARILLADGEIAAHRDLRAAFDRLILVDNQDT